MKKQLTVILLSALLLSGCVKAFLKLLKENCMKKQVQSDLR